MKYITLSIMLMISYFCVIEAMPKSLIITESDITKVKVYHQDSGWPFYPFL